MPSLIVTYADDGVANCYIDLTDADAYFAVAIHAALWEAETDDTVKEKALITSTRILDRQTWAGTKYDASQELAWPRSGVTDRDGDAVEEDEVPQEILDATCELALSLLADTALQDTSSTTSGNLKRVQAGSVQVEYFRPGQSKKFPNIVQELVGPFLRGTGLVTVGIAYGTGEDDPESLADAGDEYGLTEGLA